MLGDVGALHVPWSGFFFQAEDGIRDLVRSRGLGDVYKRQGTLLAVEAALSRAAIFRCAVVDGFSLEPDHQIQTCLLYTSDAADDLLCVDLGGRRVLNKNNIAEMVYIGDLPTSSPAAT